MEEQYFTSRTLPEICGGDMSLEQYHDYPMTVSVPGEVHWVPLVDLLPLPAKTFNINYSSIINRAHRKKIANLVFMYIIQRLEGCSLESYSKAKDYKPPKMVELLKELMVINNLISKQISTNIEGGTTEVRQTITDVLMQSHLGQRNLLEDHPDGLGRHVEVVYEGCCVDFYVLLVRFMDVLQQGKIMILYHVGEYSFTITLAAELISGLMHKYVRNGQVVSVPTTGEIVGICVDNEQVKYYLKTAISYIDENIGREGEISFINSLDVRMALSI